MANSVIVENLSKKFDINKLNRDNQFREALVNLAKRTFSRNRENKEEIWALKNVSFSVEKGEIVGIIGRNGAGKSTLLKILSKITYPTSGRINVQGRVGSLLEVGTGFHDELTGRENIYLNGSILGMTKKEVRKNLDAIIDFSEVEQFLDTPIKKYSSGMRLKLGFAVAAHLDTDILFLDEVLAVGDVAFQKKCLDTIKDLPNSGRTLIFVSHSMATVGNLCPRTLLFEKGELRQDGRTTDVINKYLSGLTELTGISKQYSFDLTHIPNRHGSGEIRYNAIEFLDLAGNPKEHIYCGDNLKVRFYYKVNKTISKPEFYFNFKTDEGTHVNTFGTALSGCEIQTLHPGTGFLDVDIEFLNLLPDRYYLTIWINTRNTIISEVDTNYDGIEHCAFIDVEVPTKTDHCRKAFDKWWGVMFIPCKWNFEGMNVSVEPIENV